MTAMHRPDELIAFWREAGRERWFGADPAFDAEIRQRFEALHHAAARGELAAWAETAAGALALVLLLDQIPRNVWRGSPHAFATDPLARRIARAAIAAGFDRQTDPALRAFFYLPFMHSEALADHDRAMPLYEALARETANDDTLKWGRHHRDIIARFGRFPHRNAALGRETTAEEAAFLAADGFAG